MLHTDRPSSAEYDILIAEEERPEQLGARLHLMSDDMGDQPVVIALPPGRAHVSVPAGDDDRYGNESLLVFF